MKPSTSELIDSALPELPAGLQSLLNFFLILLILSISILACVPPVGRDALTQHLTVPKLYLQHGGIYQIPGLDFSYNPMNLDLLYMACLYFKNDILPKYIHFSFALITAGMIYYYLKKRLNEIYGLTGAIFFLSIPIIVNLSTTAYVDLGLICFSFASLLCFLNWTEDGYRLKWLVFSGIFCGLGLGTKYNGLINLFLIACFIPFVYSRTQVHDKYKSARAIMFGLIFVLIALFLYSPWGVRNYIWTGNPVYPLFNSLVNNEVSSNSLQTGMNNHQAEMTKFQLRKFLYHESAWEVLLIPIRIFFQGRDGDPKYFDGRLNPFLFLFPFFAFFRKNNLLLRRREKLIFLSFSVLFILFAFVRRDMRIRYIGPVIPPLVILSMFGIYNLWQYADTHEFMAADRSGFIYRVLIVFSITICFMINGWYIFKRYQYIKPIQYISGQISRDSYIKRYWPEYSVYRYADLNLPKNIKILGLYMGNRGYYIDRPISFDYKLLFADAGSSASAIEIAERLRQRRITHLIVNYSLFNFWVNKVLDNDALNRLNLFFNNNVKRIYSKGGFGLYKLNSLDGNSQDHPWKMDLQTEK